MNTLCNCFLWEREKKKSYLQKRPLLHYSFLIQYLKRRGSTYDALQVIFTRKKRKHVTLPSSIHFLEISNYIGKVHIFWEGHKFLWNLCSRFVLYMNLKQNHKKLLIQNLTVQTTLPCWVQGLKLAFLSKIVSPWLVSPLKSLLFRRHCWGPCTKEEIWVSFYDQNFTGWITNFDISVHLKCGLPCRYYCTVGCLWRKSCSFGPPLFLRPCLGPSTKATTTKDYFRVLV